MAEKIRNLKVFGNKYKSLMILAVIMAISIYGARMFSYIVSVDTDLYLYDSTYFNKVWIPSEGRFAYSIIQQFIQGNSLRLNVVFINVIAVFFLVCSNFVWIYLFEKWGLCINKAAAYAFSIFYLSSTIWVEIIYFTMMAAEMMFGLVLCPVCVMLTYKCIDSKQKRKVLYFLTIFSTAFLFALHQPIALMYVEGLLVVFIMRKENGQEENEKWKGLPKLLKMASVSMVSLLSYFVLNAICMKFIYRGEWTRYATGMLSPGDVGVSIKGVVFYLYSFFVGDAATWISDPIIKASAQSGELAVKVFHKRLLHGTPFFLLSLILAAYFVFKNKKLRTDIVNYMLWTGAFLSIITFVVLTGGATAERYLYAFPLFSGFLVFYATIHINRRRLLILWMVLAVFFGYRQTYKSALMIASDTKRYEMDKWLSQEIDRRIGECSDDSHPVLILGGYDFEYGDDYLQGDVIGNSAMMWGYNNKTGITPDSVPFMASQGFYYTALDSEDERIDEIRAYAVENMPSFPDKGCTQLYKGVTVVKLSDFAYKPE